MVKRIAVFGSGNGSNFEAIVKYFLNKDKNRATPYTNPILNKNVEFICISDKKDSYILERAKKFNIKSYYVPFSETYNFLQEQKFDLVVLAGYMRILPKEVIKLAKIINIHPSLLPAFKGKDAIKKAYDARVKVTGVTVHFVNEEVDSGLIIAQEPVLIEENMSISELEENIHKTEHKLYPLVIDKLIKMEVTKS
ncbi:MAG: phosphoribosylglycinamide formyltransferase [bacterium]